MFVFLRAIRGAALSQIKAIAPKRGYAREVDLLRKFQKKIYHRIVLLGDAKSGEVSCPLTQNSPCLPESSDFEIGLVPPLRRRRKSGRPVPIFLHHLDQFPHQSSGAQNFIYRPSSRLAPKTSKNYISKIG